jgi:hypothetical protein
MKVQPRPRRSLCHRDLSGPQASGFRDREPAAARVLALPLGGRVRSTSRSCVTKLTRRRRSDPTVGASRLSNQHPTMLLPQPDSPARPDPFDRLHLAHRPPPDDIETLSSGLELRPHSPHPLATAASSHAGAACRPRDTQGRRSTGQTVSIFERRRLGASCRQSQGQGLRTRSSLKSVPGFFGLQSQLRIGFQASRRDSFCALTKANLILPNELALALGVGATPPAPTGASSRYRE